MGKRVNIDGPGDDPDEYWFECPACDGLGFHEGDADGVD